MGRSVLRVGGFVVSGLGSSSIHGEGTRFSTGAGGGHCTVGAAVERRDVEAVEGLGEPSVTCSVVVINHGAGMSCGAVDGLDEPSVAPSVVVERNGPVDRRSVALVDVVVVVTVCDDAGICLLYTSPSPRDRG